MKTVNYILVNDMDANGGDFECRQRFIPHIGLCIVVEAGGFGDGFKLQVARCKLLDELVRLRRKWPEAKILGVSELDTSATHAPVRVNPEMNKLRLELSGLT